MWTDLHTDNFLLGGGTSYKKYKTLLLLEARKLYFSRSDPLSVFQLSVAVEARALPSRKLPAELLSRDSPIHTLQSLHTKSAVVTGMVVTASWPRPVTAGVCATLASSSFSLVIFFPLGTSFSHSLHSIGADVGQVSWKSEMFSNGLPLGPGPCVSRLVTPRLDSFAALTSNSRKTSQDVDVPSLMYTTSLC